MENSSPFAHPNNSQSIFAALRDVLADLYPEENDARVVVDDAGLDARQITFSSRAQTNWHHILTEAVYQHRLDGLLSTARTAYPDNPRLYAAYTQYALFSEQGGELTPPTHPPTITIYRELDHITPVPGQSPFKGLQFFDIADVGLFFGREQLTADLVDYLHHHRFLAVVGASGSGKSSIVRAGLVPALQRAEPLAGSILPPKGSDQWPIHILTPKAHPLKELAATLTHNNESDLDQARLMDELAQDERVLDLRVSRLLRGSSADRLLLIVDQFEELFTLCRNSQERQAFIDNLLTAAVDDGVTTVVITLRADFYHRCADFTSLRLVLQEHQKYIGPMSDEELRQAIEEPARLGGWELETGLVDLLLDDVAAQPGALPLLSHALLETWRRRRGRTLTLAGYAASGRVRGAIAQTADAVLNQQLTDEQRPIARNIFMRLTELGEGVQDTRRRVMLTELTLTGERADLVEKVLQALADARLITTDQNEVEVAHEALIREWATLREWLADDRNGLRIHRRLTEAAREWLSSQYDSSYLLRGNRLSQAQEWATDHVADLNQLEQMFLQASQVEVDKQVQQAAIEQRRRVQLFRRWSIAASVLLLLAVLAGVFSLYLNTQLNDKNEQLGDINKKLNETLKQRDQNVQELDAANNQLQTSLVETKRLADIALSRQLAAQSVNELSKNNYELAILLAIESGKITDTLEAFAAIRTAIAFPWHSRLVVYGYTDGVMHAEWSKDESKILTVGCESMHFACEKSSVHIWDAATGKKLATCKRDNWTECSNDDNKAIFTESNDVERVGDAVTSKELVKLKGQYTGNIFSAIWSQDKSKILTGGQDGTARIWDTATSKELVRFEGHTGDVYSAMWNQDESKVLTCSSDGTARIWNVATGKEVMKFEDQMGSVAKAEWSKDETRILTISTDGPTIMDGINNRTARIWDATNGNQLLQIGSALSIAWSKDQRKILAGGIDGTTEIWDTITNQKLTTLKAHSSSVSQVIWNNDESKILTGSTDGTVRIWETSPGTELVAFKGGIYDPRQIEWSEDETKILAVGCEHSGIFCVEGNIYIWDANTGKELIKIPGFNEAIWGKDETKILTNDRNGTGYNGTGYIWNATTGEWLVKFDDVQWLSWNKNENRVLTSNTYGIARIWDATTGEILAELGKVDSAIWSKDGNTVLTRDNTGAVRMLNATTGKELIKLEGYLDYIYSAVWSKDGNKVLIRHTDPDYAHIWDTNTGKELVKLEGTTDLEWSRDESKILIFTYPDDVASVWDMVSGKYLFHIKGVSSAKLSHDGSKIITTDEYPGYTIRIWDATNGRELAKIDEKTDSIATVLWSKDENKILITGDNNTVSIWDVSTSKELAKLEGHTDFVHSAVWSEDERMILTTSRDDTARIWDTITGKELIKFEGVTSAIWSKDNNKIVTSNKDGTIYISYVQMSKLLKAACHWVPRNLSWIEWTTYIQSKNKEKKYSPTCLNAPIPPDIIASVQTIATKQIRSDQIVSATLQLEQLNSWLQVNGQFSQYGVNVSAFVLNALATATPRPNQTPTVMLEPSTTMTLRPTSTPTPQSKSPMFSRSSSPLSTPTPVNPQLSR